MSKEEKELTNCKQAVLGVIIFLTMLLAIPLFVIRLPFSVYVILSRIYHILISNIGLTAVIAAAALGLNRKTHQDSMAVFTICWVAIALIILLSICAYTGSLDITSFNDQYIYRGQTFENRAEGYGTLYDKQTGEMIYAGNFSANQYNRFGILYKQYTDPEGKPTMQIQYAGNFKDHQRNGYGIEFMYEKGINHVCYTGYFEDGLYKGEGDWYVYLEDYRDGNITSAFQPFQYSLQYEELKTAFRNQEHLFRVYHGTFRNNNFNGDHANHYVWENGNAYLWYHGSFQNNMHEGEGTLYYPNGEKKYEGQFKENQYNGYGTEYELQYDEATNTEKAIPVHEGIFSQGIFVGTLNQE